MKQKDRRFTIGRDPRCDVRVADDSVSRVHAELTCLDDGTLLLRDCGSSNGTRLVRRGVSRAITQEAVHRTDTVQLGGASITVSEMLTVLDGRLPPLPAPARASAPQPPAAHNDTKLERCACGTIKPVHQPCPECRQ